MHLVQSVPDRWNVVIIEVRHEEQIFASLSKLLFNTNIRDVRDVKLLIVSFRNSHRDIWSQWSGRAWS
jgi:hypothetical protein